MKKIYYEKKGRRYVPIAEYDSDYIDSFPEGSHLVMCHPGGSSRRFNVDPNYAAMIAAGRVAEDAICKSILDASAMRPAKIPITEEQRRAWKALSKAFGDECTSLHSPCIRDAAEAGIKAMMVEAEKLMSNPAVKNAYEHFLLVCELTKEEKKCYT